jgi:hypothetical protein
LLSRQETEENLRSTTSIGNPGLLELERTTILSLLKEVVTEDTTISLEPAANGGNSIDSTADTSEMYRTPRSSPFGLAKMLKVNKLPVGLPIMVKTKSGPLCTLTRHLKHQLKV